MLPNLSRVVTYRLALIRNNRVYYFYSVLNTDAAVRTIGFNIKRTTCLDCALSLKYEVGEVEKTMLRGGIRSGAGGFIGVGGPL